MKGYKAFDKNLQCRGLQFTVGETKSVIGKVEICKNGIHFCEKLSSVFNYYDKDYDTRICEIVASGQIVTEGDKSCAEFVTVVRELSKEEIKNLTDDLKFNSGHYNSGDYNSGNRNSGHFNSGHYNSGDYNSGNRNSGNYNSGNRNSGNYNSGNRNSGDYNSGDYNSGYFNTNSPKVRLFNKETTLDFSDKKLDKLQEIVSKYWKVHLNYIYTKDMTDQEKLDNKSHETTGGFLRKDDEYSYKKSWKNVWSKCTDSEKEFIKSLPNFDMSIFEEITGIKIEEEIEVIVSGVTKKISKEAAKHLGLI